ncbi:MAG: hypothetical protein JXA60_09005 [Candidatus Coatesbacteria bacterium]|nr:hypothetical protein [Candidatus Coatesbacteria bacterium]
MWKTFFFCIVILLAGCGIEEDMKWFNQTTQNDVIICENNVDYFTPEAEIEFKLIKILKPEIKFSATGAEIGSIVIDSKNLIFFTDNRRCEVYKINSQSFNAELLVPFGHLENHVSKPFGLALKSDTLWVGDLLRRAWICFDRNGFQIREMKFENTLPTDIIFSKNSYYAVFVNYEGSRLSRNLYRMAYDDNSRGTCLYSAEIDCSKEGYEKLLFNYTVDNNEVVTVCPYETDDYTIEIISGKSVYAKIKKSYNAENLETDNKNFNNEMVNRINNFCHAGNKMTKIALNKNFKKRSILFSFIDGNGDILACCNEESGDYRFDLFSKEGVLTAQGRLKGARDALICYSRPYIIVYKNQLPQAPLISIYSYELKRKKNEKNS